MISIREIFTSTYNQLQSVYPKPESKEITYRLMMHYFSLSKIDIALNPNMIIAKDDVQVIDVALKRLLAKEPLQYVLCETEFYDLSFFVNEAVLIPRPETEELVKLIIEKHQQQSPSILDIGTGSGCIPVVLKKHFEHSNVRACDVSEEALAIARKNALQNNVEVDFFQCDILYASCRDECQYDIIVSNPPYVLDSEKDKMRDNVLNYEPHLALFVDDNNALVFYDAISNFATKHLNDGGTLYFEINEAKGKAVSNMLKDRAFCEVCIHRDIFGKDRMVSAKWKI